ncbi:ATP-binding cassette domain-containing protein [Pseudonocardiaceae bacterium YIM PH 21723]|nr:ATP-binding cassette domain-containing protein [Pseudonocardiaceae bacterium YIM PH 21723]
MKRTLYGTTYGGVAVNDTAEAAVIAEELRKSYRDKEALDGFDLLVRPGTVHGLLGPNGAGKTTAVRILTTLLRADSGHARVAGLDVRRHSREVKRQIGLVGQQTAVDEALSGRQNLEMFGRLFHLGVSRARSRATGLLDQFGLGDTGNKPVKQYSGGMRRRLDLAASLILRPAVLFLDEPTTGLDPHGRAEIWSMVRDLVAAGTTVLLTTQYLDEADQLADRISVLRAGRVIAEGAPDELKSRLRADRIDVVLRDGEQLAEAARLLGAQELDADSRRLSLPAPEGIDTLLRVATRLADGGIKTEDVGLRRPTLDEVFLRLTEQKEVAA